MSIRRFDPGRDVANSGRAKTKTLARGVSGDLCCAPVTEAPLSESEAGELADVLAAMADPVRLRLLSIVSGQGSVCSCDLEGPLRRSQPTISHHTRILADAGLIVGERRGKWTWWSTAPERLDAVRRALGGAG